MTYGDLFDSYRLKVESLLRLASRAGLKPWRYPFSPDDLAFTHPLLPKTTGKTKSFGNLIYLHNQADVCESGYAGARDEDEGVPSLLLIGATHF